MLAVVVLVVVVVVMVMVHLGTTLDLDVKFVALRAEAAFTLKMAKASIVGVLSIRAVILVVTEAVNANTRMGGVLSVRDAAGLLGCCCGRVRGGLRFSARGLVGLEEIDELLQRVIGDKGSAQLTVGLLGDRASAGSLAIVKIRLDRITLVSVAVGGDDGRGHDRVALNNALHLSETGLGGGKLSAVGVLLALDLIVRSLHGLYGASEGIDLLVNTGADSLVLAELWGEGSGDLIGVLEGLKGRLGRSLSAKGTADLIHNERFMTSEIDENPTRGM